MALGSSPPSRQAGAAHHRPPSHDLPATPRHGTAGMGYRHSVVGEEFEATKFGIVSADKDDKVTTGLVVRMRDAADGRHTDGKDYLAGRAAEERGAAPRPFRPPPRGPLHPVGRAAPPLTAPTRPL